jgi:Alkylmercury lyase
MTAFERAVRAAVIQWLWDRGQPPSVSAIATTVDASEAEVRVALHVLAHEHRLVLLPGTEAIWMAHPFSGVPTDVVVRVGHRQWFANCVWDGLSILSLLGDGILQTHSPASGEPIVLTASSGVVKSDAVVHFLVPARRFWDDIGFT